MRSYSGMLLKKKKSEQTFGENLQMKLLKKFPEALLKKFTKELLEEFSKDFQGHLTKEQLTISPMELRKEFSIELLERFPKKLLRKFPKKKTPVGILNRTIGGVSKGNPGQILDVIFLRNYYGRFRQKLSWKF